MALTGEKPVVRRDGVHVGAGSKTVLTAPKRHFRVTPRNGHRQAVPACPKSANMRLFAIDIAEAKCEGRRPLSVSDSRNGNL